MRTWLLPRSSSDSDTQPCKPVPTAQHVPTPGASLETLAHGIATTRREIVNRILISAIPTRNLHSELLSYVHFKSGALTTDAQSHKPALKIMQNGSDIPSNRTNRTS